MKVVIMAIHDRQLNAYMAPFPSQAIGAAIREFGNLANDAQHPVGKHPEDYSLYHIGHFEDTTGELTKLERPEQVAIATNLLAQRN